ncbi:enoyl-CoA hydratase/isomerase family protein [Natronomonas sp. EA1]|uniref:enoyl-CoA hydratase/isomerase family protein n=1 Tax=Natronomonas sp. EA1 TaxID=3421655 RepID=UPI003EC004FB
MAETVTLEIEAEIATLTVDRPEALNALNVPTVDAIRDAVTEAEAEGARVLVVTGAGEKAFVAGADISYMKSLSPAEAKQYAEKGHTAFRAIENFPGPTIAKVNGFALGGGCELALACDMRVASERAVLGQPEIDLGIIPGFGGTQRLKRVVGDERARRLIYFGDRLDAQDAYEYGLVGEVVAHDELDERVASLASDLTKKPRHALAAAKDAINAQGDLTARLEREQIEFADLFDTPDQREGMEAFVEKREPDFE